MLGLLWNSGIEDVKWTKSGDVLEVEGILIYPGTFTGLDGRPTEFTEDVIKEILEGVDGNVPLKLTHFSDAIIGYATKLGLDDNGRLWFKGFVFDEGAIDKIVNGGYSGISGEFQLEMDGEKAVGGILTAIAFVETPAAPQAGVKEAKSVELSNGGEDEMEDEEVEMGRKKKKPTPEEFFKYIEEELKKKGVSDVRKVMDVIRGVFKTPYPYPYPKPTADMSEELEKVKREMEMYRRKWLSVKDKEFEELVKELKEFGVSDPEAVVSGIDDIEQKIAILQRMKEALMMKSEPESKEKLESTSGSDAIAKAAEAFGMTVDELRELMNGGEE